MDERKWTKIQHIPQAIKIKKRKDKNADPIIPREGAGDSPRLKRNGKSKMKINYG